MPYLLWNASDRPRRRFCLPAVLLLLGNAGLCAARQEAPPQPAGEAGAAAQTTPAAAPEFDRSLAGVNRARALFDKVVETYRTAPAIRDEVTVTLRFSGGGEEGEQSSTVPLIISRQGVRITLNDITFTAIDGTIYGEYAPKPKRLFVEDFQGPLSVDLFTIQNSIFPFPHFGLCLSDTPIDELFQFTFDARLVGHRTIDDAKLGSVEQILVESSTEGAPCTLTIDPATSLVLRFESELKDLANPDTKWLITSEMKPQPLDHFPIEEIVVDMDGRKMVQSVGLLVAEHATADLIDTPSPDFTFTDPEGNTLSLEDCAGKATAIMFWWIPSEAESPVLESVIELQKWIEQEQLTAQIVPVNCGDRVEDLDLYLEGRKVEIDRWQDEGGAASIGAFFAPKWPTTVVISPAGKVVQAFVGTDPSGTFTERVRKAIHEALNEDL